MFGTSGNGKLKADEWGLCMEFDILVAFIQYWDVKRQCAPPDDAMHITALMDNTMALVMAGCSLVHLLQDLLISLRQV